MNLSLPPLSTDFLLFWLSLGLAALSLFGYFVASTVCVLWRRHTRRRRGTRPHLSPGISILKPISGIDEELEQNLVSFFELDHEPLQLIFCADSPRDPGLLLVRDVAQRYPGRDVLIMDQQDSNAASPKVANLESMLPHAKYEFVLLSDSNVRIGRHDLSHFLRPMEDPRVGLVYQPVTGIGEQCLTAAMENLRLTEYAGMLTVGAKVVFLQEIVMAKGIFCRRQAMADAGDFAHVRDMMADDYLLAMGIKQAGWKLAMCDEPAYVVHVHWPWHLFYKRHLRHATCRWRLCWPAYPLEIGFNPIMCALPALFLTGAWGPLVFAAAVVAKIALEVIACGTLRGRFPAPRYWPAIMLKDLIGYFIWWHALVENRVSWRGIQYRITTRSKMVRTAEGT